MKNEKGFIGLLAMLVAMAVAVIWMGYLLRNGWDGKGGINLSGGLPGAVDDPQPSGINGQLDDLRKNVKGIQNARDKEITDAMNGK